MNILKCKVEGCTSVFQTEEPLHPEAMFTCKLHLPSKQRVRFQSVQFDKQLRGGRNPIGTNHIKNQGSQVATAGDSVPAETDE